MDSALLIAGRELKSFLRSPLAYLVIAIMLLIDGLLFYALAMGGQPRLSAEVLRDFFFYTSGTTAVSALLLSMRLFAEERQTGTFVLLNTAPVTDTSIVIGKFLSAFALVAGFVLLTLYMPLLIFVHGRVSVGHIAIGYLGVLLFGATATAVGLFGSVLVRSQVVAVILGAAIFVALLLLWWIGKETDPPIRDFLIGLSVHNNRFRPFMQGQLELEQCVYYLAVTYLFLLGSTKVLEARRWR